MTNLCRHYSLADECYIVHLLYFGGGAFEQLDVSVANALAVLRQRLVSTVITGEQHERVAGGASVGVVYEQDTVFAVQNVDRRQALPEELQLQRRRPVQTQRSLSQLGQKFIAHQQRCIGPISLCKIHSLHRCNQIHSKPRKAPYFVKM